MPEAFSYPESFGGPKERVYISQLLSTCKQKDPNQSQKCSRVKKKQKTDKEEPLGVDALKHCKYLRDDVVAVTDLMLKFALSQG